uniref:RNA-polymerase sigma factor n=1 Tax=Lotharella vacuolata TaxID=74820 RepID=A0A0H5BGZ3_9EUKA|nr:RNA-polymerase sigma factor [Lotharella vacuolata]
MEHSKLLKINKIKKLMIQEIKNIYFLKKEKKTNIISIINKSKTHKKSVIDNIVISHVKKILKNRTMQTNSNVSSIQDDRKLLFSKIDFENESVLIDWVIDFLKIENAFWKVKEKYGFFPSLQFMEKYSNYTLKEIQDTIIVGKCCKKILIKKSLKLIVSISKKYLDKGLEFEDLIAEGLLGLMKGIKKYDYTKGRKFTTYAHWWIRQSISRAIDDQSKIIKIPVYVKEILSKIKKIKASYYEKHNKYPSIKQLSSISGINEDRIQKVLESCNDIVSLDTTLNSNDKNDFLRDSIEDISTVDTFDYAIEKNLKNDIEKALMTLSDRESAVIRLRYGLDDGKERTLEEIGEFLNVTRERIRQIETKALNKLRSKELEDLLSDYL